MAGETARLVAVIVVLLGAVGAPRAARAEVNVADTGNFVIDQAHVIDPQTRQKLENYLKELDQKTTAQVKVLTVPTTDGEDIFPFAQRQFDHWKLGQRGKDNGALIVLAIKERQARVHTGYGLEGALPDGWNGTLLRAVRDKYFRQGNYAQGLHDLAVAVANKVADEQGVKLEGVPEIRHQGPRQDPSGEIIAALMIVALIVLLFSMRKRTRYRRHWRGDFSDSAYWGSVLGDILSSGGNSTWGGGSSGGFGGGGFGGGGGGGGSFGGGGSSGGGGASTSW